MARALLSSVRVHHPEADLFLGLADRADSSGTLYDPAWTVIEAEQLDIPGFRSFAFRYDIMEFNTAIKPFVFIHLLEERGYDDVIYFDPDIEVHRPLTSVLGPLGAGRSFVLTPHLGQPLEVEAEPNDISIMRAGVYNLGFLGVGRCEESVRLIRWWGRRLRYQCVSAQDQGIFVDQKFMDLIPGFARNAHVSHDTTLNVAYWNLSQRAFGGSPGVWTVDGQALTFFHFSGFNPRRPSKLSKYTTRFDGDMPRPLQQLAERYAQTLIANRHGTLPGGAYAYGHFGSGAAIHPYIRRMFRERQEDWPSDPFWSYEDFLDEASPEVVQHAPEFRVTNLMKFIYDATPPLNRGLDLANPDQARDLVRWFVFASERDIQLDPRLVIPAMRRMERAGERRHQGAQGAVRRADASVIGYLRTASGVGEAGRQTLCALADAGLDVEGLDVDLNVLGSRDERGLEHHLVEQGTGRVQIFHINADQLPQVSDHVHGRIEGDAVRVCVPFWELSRFPQPWLGAFDRVDEIWAPSRFIQRALLESVSKPVLHMPPALDVLPPPRQRRSRFGLPDDAFLFFFAFDFLSFMERKNPIGTIAAFKLFRERERAGRAMLVVKTMNGAHTPSALAAIREEIGADPDIVVLDETMRREDTLALISAIDCVVSLHRSEGLGLLVAEAMLLGKPVIATDYSATTDLVTPETGFPVSYTLIPVKEGQYPFGEGQVWADPDVLHAAWHMARIFEAHSSELVASIVLRAHEMVRSRHSRQQVGATLARRINQIVS